MTESTKAFEGLARSPAGRCKHDPASLFDLPRLRQEVRPVPVRSSMARQEHDQIVHFGEENEFVLKMAVDEEDRLKAWHLVYREYLGMGYVSSQQDEYRYSIHDALPDTATFLVERGGQVAGTVSVFSDSPLALPADEIYGTELNKLRKAGRRLAEIGRLSIAPEFARDRQILMKMVEIPCLYARSVLSATDAVITINPRHASFYQRMMLFESMGEQQSLGSVCGAPAVLLRLGLDWQRDVIDWARREGPAPAGIDRRARAVYRCFSSRKEETTTAERSRRARRPLGRRFLARHFIHKRPLISRLDLSAISFLERCYPALRNELP